MPNVIASVKALIKYKNKYLVLKAERNNLVYRDLPGGKVKYKEEPLEALRREIKEEVNLDIALEQFNILGLWYFYSATHKHQVVCTTFMAEISDIRNLDIAHNPAAKENILEFGWFNIEEILNLNKPKINKSLAKLLQDIK